MNSSSSEYAINKAAFEWLQNKINESGSLSIDDLKKIAPVREVLAGILNGMKEQLTRHGVSDELQKNLIDSVVWVVEQDTAIEQVDSTEDVVPSVDGESVIDVEPSLTIAVRMSKTPDQLLSDLAANHESNLSASVKAVLKTYLHWLNKALDNHLSKVWVRQQKIMNYLETQEEEKPKSARNYNLTPESVFIKSLIGVSVEDLRADLPAFEKSLKNGEFLPKNSQLLSDTDSYPEKLAAAQSFLNKKRAEIAALPERTQAIQATHSFEELIALAQARWQTANLKDQLEDLQDQYENRDERLKSALTVVDRELASFVLTPEEDPLMEPLDQPDLQKKPTLTENLSNFLRTKVGRATAIVALISILWAGTVKLYTSRQEESLKKRREIDLNIGGALGISADSIAMVDDDGELERMRVFADSGLSTHPINDSTLYSEKDLFAMMNRSLKRKYMTSWGVGKQLLLGNLLESVGTHIKENEVSLQTQLETVIDSIYDEATGDFHITMYDLQYRPWLFGDIFNQSVDPMGQIINSLAQMHPEARSITIEMPYAINGQDLHYEYLTLPPSLGKFKKLEKIQIWFYSGKCYLRVSPELFSLNQLKDISISTPAGSLKLPDTKYINKNKYTNCYLSGYSQYNTGGVQ